MGFKRKIGMLLLLLLSSVGITSFPQTVKPDKEKLDQNFKFRNGIFLDFNQVKNNNPVPKARILTTVSYNDREFFDKVFEQEVISYFDDFGLRKQVKKENIWGYAKNGILYIQLDNNFSRISIVGGICHFVGMITTYDTRYVDPYYRFNYPYYYRAYPGYYPTETYTKTEMRQFILDFETGKVMEYNTQSIEMALMRDPQLYDEYVRLRNKKKKQLKFLYIRKFNERNPVYLPVNR
ncbi:MAG: hypothetical protein GXO83_08220 [Chlorobi bacterium]|nr:hypothetical protein [Chlorobiota bacterium]